jgi:hypothetical protein
LERGFLLTIALGCGGAAQAASKAADRAHNAKAEARRRRGRVVLCIFRLSPLNKGAAT